MIWLFLAVAILCAAHTSTPAQAPPPAEEIKIGDVAEVAEIDPVKDANAEKG